MAVVPVIASDQSLAFLAEGYAFGHRRFERLGTDAFRTRLMGRRVLMLRGHRAVRFFYEGDRFTRTGAVPRSVLHSLQDTDSVQTLTGAPHRRRKSLFVEALADGEALRAEFERAWDRAEREWIQAGRVAVLPAAGAVLTAAALAWAGIPVDRETGERRTAEFLAMIDGAGSFGWRNWRGRALRLRTERWATGVVRAAVDGEAPEGSPLQLVARHEDGLGSPMTEHARVVELLNLLRPVTAVARFIAFAALALHRQPAWIERVREDPADAARFAQEVRRTAPFFPAIGGRAVQALDLDGIAIGPDEWVVVDLFATNRHPAEWTRADRFDPDRFATTSPPEVVAQGGGDIATGHRCPGEPATVDLLVAASERLAALPSVLAPQSLRVALDRLPAQPGHEGVRLLVGATADAVA